MKRELHEHQQSCTYEPCHCPLPGCGFDGSCRDLYLHFAGMHSASAIRFTFDSSFPVHIGANTKYKFLQEAGDHTLFILNYGVDALGNVADVICVGSRSVQNEYSYDLEAGNVQRSARVTSVTQSLPRWTGGLAPKPILVVTKDLIDSPWDHKIQVCIRSKGENWIRSVQFHRIAQFLLNILLIEFWDFAIQKHLYLLYCELPVLLFSQTSFLWSFQPFTLIKTPSEKPRKIIIFYQCRDIQNITSKLVYVVSHLKQGATTIYEKNSDVICRIVSHIISSGIGYLKLV